MTLAQHRARSTGAAPTPGRSRRPHRVRPGLAVLGVPVTMIVAVELVLACALVAARKHTGSAIAAGVLGVLVIVAVLLQRRGIRLGTRVLLRIGYLMRQRVVLVAATEYASADAIGADMDRIEVPPELPAFFPGIRVWEATTHERDRMGVVQWQGSCSATMEISQAGGIVRQRNPRAVPADAVVTALAGRDLGIDAVQILTHTIVGERDGTQAPLLGTAASELYSTGSRVRNRNVYVTVRIDPAAAAAAIAARGGGRAGIERVLATALSAVRGQVIGRGMSAAVLDGAAVGRAVAESLYHPATSFDPIIRWTESARDISSTRMVHGSYAVGEVRRGSLEDIPMPNVFAYAVGTQLRPGPNGTFTNTSVVRLSCRSRSALGPAAREARSGARRAGITLRPIECVQLVGLRATIPMGGI